MLQYNNASKLCSLAGKAAEHGQGCSCESYSSISGPGQALQGSSLKQAFNAASVSMSMSQV